MKKLLVRLAMVLIIIIISLSFVTPAFAYSLASTGWYGNFHNIHSDYSMLILNYYQNNTSSSVYLAYSTFHIDNWGDHEWGIIAYLENDIYYDGGSKNIASMAYPDIQPEEYWYGNMSLGYTTYSKEWPGSDDFVLTEHYASDWGELALCGWWEMFFWDDLSITKQYYP